MFESWNIEVSVEEVIILNTNPKYLYHYCTFGTFEKMINSKTIRLSDLLNSNDPKEDKLILEIIRTIVKEKRIEHSEFSLDLIENSRKNTKILGICFTGCENSEYFYENYAKFGGLSLCFDYCKLSTFFNQVSTDYGETLGLKKVVYLSKDSIIEEVKGQIENIIKKEEYIINCGTYVLFNGDFYKEKERESENEYRAAFRLLFLDKILNGEELMNVNGYNLMPFITFNDTRYFAIPDIARSYFFIDLPFEFDLIEQIYVPSKFRSEFEKTVSVINSFYDSVDESIQCDLEKLLNRVTYVDDSEIK